MAIYFPEILNITTQHFFEGRSSCFEDTCGQGVLMQTTNWRLEIAQLALIVGMFVVAVVTWTHAPDQLPVHWNLRGEVDRYGGKVEALLLVPLISAGLYALLLALPALDPGWANYKSFRNVYAMIRLAILVFLALIYGCIQLAVFGHDINMSVVIPLAVGSLFMLLGNLMGKIRPNWFVGVRTPWTLSSRRSWNKTHRLAGWCFVLLGALLIACGLTRSEWMVMTTMVASVVFVFWMILYSYLVWRSDPDRVSPAGTSPEATDA